MITGEKTVPALLKEKCVKTEESIYCTILLYENDMLRKNGYSLVSTIEEFEKQLWQHELNTYNKYIIFKTNGSFKGKVKDPIGKPRIHWGELGKVSPDLSTMPYLSVATRYYCCHFGKCYYASKLQENVSQTDGANVSRRRYKKVTSSKKVGCPASFKVQRLIMFPENKINNDNKSERACMGEYIRKNISSVKLQNCYLFRFPDSDEHLNHINKTEIFEKEPVDRMVVEKIRELVLSGVTNILPVAEALEDYVENELGVKDKSRRKFYPFKKDIRRLINCSKIKLRRSKNDEHKLYSLIKELDCENDVYFRSSDCNSQINLECCANGDGITARKPEILFVYQNAEMKRLYNLYGHQCILLDPTYRFCKFSFPLYSLVVQTNVNYLLVAVFITENETKEAITEALNIVSDWNPKVIPRYCITDNCGCEVSAVESAFPGIKIFFGFFYCETSWQLRLSRRDMRNINQHDVFTKLKNICNAVTKDMALQEISALRTWPPFSTSPPLRSFYEKSWQKDVKRWCIAYRPKDLYFETNDAIDRLDEELQYSILSQWRGLTLSEMVRNLYMKFIPDTLTLYRTLNVNAVANRPQANDIILPHYLQNRPQWIVDHILRTMKEANEELLHSRIENIEQMQYAVVSLSSNDRFYVHFNHEEELLGYTCTCFLFIKRRLICKHLIILGKLLPAWNMEKLSSWLLSDPVFRLDDYWGLKEVDCKRQRDVEFKSFDRETSQAIVPESCSVSDQILRAKCRDCVFSLSSITDCLSNEELKNFTEDIQSLCRKWMKKPLRKNSQEEEKEVAEPFLRKISDFYSTKLPLGYSNKKVQRQNRAKSWKRKSYETNTSSDMTENYRCSKQLCTKTKEDMIIIDDATASYDSNVPYDQLSSDVVIVISNTGDKCSASLEK